MSLSRRGLFGIIAGAVAAPFVKARPSRPATVLAELQYVEHGVFTRYSGYETLNVTSADVIAASEFDWARNKALTTIVRGFKKRAFENSVPECRS